MTTPMNPTEAREATAAQMEMARRICAEHDHNKAYQYLDGSRDDYPTMKIALAAIIEATEAEHRRIVEWLSEQYDSAKDASIPVNAVSMIDTIRKLIEEGAHRK